MADWQTGSQTRLAVNSVFRKRKKRRGGGDCFLGLEPLT